MRYDMASKRERKRKRKSSLIVPWSQLPIDVLDNIIKRLDFSVDVVSFSGVCTPWRHVALGMHMSLYCKLPMHHFAPSRSPLPMLLHPGCENTDTHQLYSLNKRKMYGGFHLRELGSKWIVGSGAGWVVTVDTTDPEINLMNPLTGKTIPLPHLSTIPSCDLNADVDDPTAYWYIRKVIVCSYQGSFLVVALVSEYQMIRFCKIGDTKWTRLQNSPLFVDDIIMHNGKLHAVNGFGALFEIDIADSAKVTLIAVPRLLIFRCKYFLVSLCGELVLLARTLLKLRLKRESQMTSGFQVFKLVEDESGYFEEYETEAGMQHPEKVGHSWARLETLGHHMVFIGYNHSLSLDSRLYPRCKGNHIYFADYRHEGDDHRRMRGKSNKLYHDVGVYHLAEQKVKHFKHSSKASSPMNMVWLSPNLSSELEIEMIPQ